MHTLKRTLEIDAPPNEVWRVLTTPELVREWAAAYDDGIQIKTSFREGEPVTWKGRKGETPTFGTVAASKPGRLLRFDYQGDPSGAFSETFEISPNDQGSRLRFTSGPFDEAEAEALKRATELAIDEIKSLAEESAQIHGLR
jgi:uncharacterized protein YndB with AHSA1/START domain